MSEHHSELFNHAYHLFTVHQYREAEVELQHVLEDEPGNAWAYALLALCLAFREDFRPATRAARTGVDKAPDLAFAHYALASVLDDQDMFNEALISIRQAIRLDPDDVLFYAQMAVIYLQQQRWTEAIEAAERGLQVNDDDEDCRHILEQARSMVGQMEHTEAESPSELPRNPQAALAYTDAGLAALYDGRRGTAMSYFRHALSLDPDLTRARWGIVGTMKAGSRLQGGALSLLLRLANLPGLLRALLVCAVFGACLIVRDAVLQRPALIGPAVAVVGLVYVIWMAKPLFNALLYLSAMGRQALSTGLKRQAVMVWLGLLTAAIWFVIWLFRRQPTAANVAILLALLTIPFSRTYVCPRGWSRLAMALYCLLLALLAAVVVWLHYAGIEPLTDWGAAVFGGGVLLAAGFARVLRHEPAGT